MLKKMHPRFYSRVSHSSFKGECIFFVYCDYVVWPLCRTDFSAQRCSSGHDAAVERTAKQMTWLDWVKKDIWLVVFHTGRKMFQISWLRSDTSSRVLVWVDCEHRQWRFACSKVVPVRFPGSSSLPPLYVTALARLLPVSLCLFLLLEAFFS